MSIRPLKYPKVTIYTDGGCRNNQQRENVGGFGIIIDLDGSSPPKKMTGYEFNTTNNRMELGAVVHALKNLPHIIDGEYPEVTIYTDSKYVSQAAIAWVYNWKRNGWRTASGNDVANLDLWLRYLDAVRDYPDVIVLHCPRDSHPMNSQADKLANKAMDEAERHGIRSPLYPVDETEYIRGEQPRPEQTL